MAKRKRIKKKERGVVTSLMKYFENNPLTTIYAGITVFYAIVIAVYGVAVRPNVFPFIILLGLIMIGWVFKMRKSDELLRSILNKNKQEDIPKVTIVPTTLADFEKSQQKMQEQKEKNIIANASKMQKAIYERLCDCISSQAGKYGNFKLSPTNMYTFFMMLEKDDEFTCPFSCTYYGFTYTGNVIISKGLPRKVVFDEIDGSQLPDLVFNTPKNPKPIVIEEPAKASKPYSSNTKKIKNRERKAEEQKRLEEEEAKENSKKKDKYPPKEDKQNPKPKPKEEPKPTPEPKQPKEDKKNNPNPEPKNDDNTEFDENGKKRVKPNFQMIAKDWISSNYKLLNKVCGDAAVKAGTGKAYSAVIPAKYLPERQESWSLIGQQMVDNDDVDKFQVVDGGLKVTVF